MKATHFSQLINKIGKVEDSEGGGDGIGKQSEEEIG